MQVVVQAVEGQREADTRDRLDPEPTGRSVNEPRCRVHDVSPPLLPPPSPGGAATVVVLVVLVVLVEFGVGAVVFAGTVVVDAGPVLVGAVVVGAVVVVVTWFGCVVDALPPDPPLDPPVDPLPDPSPGDCGAA